MWSKSELNLAVAFVSDADQALMMTLQYDNGYSSDSVAVQTLSGTLLGYVPRRHNHRFIHDVNFGHVYAVGQDAAGLWRLTVRNTGQLHFETDILLRI